MKSDTNEDDDNTLSMSKQNNSMSLYRVVKRSKIKIKHLSSSNYIQEISTVTPVFAFKIFLIMTKI